MSDHLIWWGRTPRGPILGRVGVTHEQRVVAPHDSTVNCRTDAGIGLGTGNDETSDTQARQHRLEIGFLEGVAVLLLDSRLLIGR